MRLLLIIAGYTVCLIFEMPVRIKDERKKLVIFLIFMVISIVETIIVVFVKDLPSIASIIEKVFGPLSKKIYGS